MKIYLRCSKEKNKLPRVISKQDREVKFNHKDQRYEDLLKKNYKNFNFNANFYIDNNLPRNASDKRLDKAKEKSFKDYGEQSKDYLRVELFLNLSIIKLWDCTFAPEKGLKTIPVTIYYNHLTNVIVNKNNILVYFGVATEISFADIFAYKEKETTKIV